MAGKEISGSESSTFPLNYDCMLEVFKFLDLKACMNFADAYDNLQEAANYTYGRRFTELTIDFDEPVDRYLYHVGPFIKSLTLILDKNSVKESDLVKISETCTKVQCLTLQGFGKEKVNFNPCCSFTNILEHLTLSDCCMADDDNFFGTSTNLKSLNLKRCCDINTNSVVKCFVSNQGITSFTTTYDTTNFWRCLLLLPNVERLSLHCNMQNLHSLASLKKLRHLTLHCWSYNVNNILVDLVKANRLVELVLQNVKVDHYTFSIIKSFTNLKMLAVTTYEHSEFPLADDLPPQLSALKLGGFNISRSNILSLVEELKHLQDLHLEDCFVTNVNGLIFNYFEVMADLIVEDLKDKEKNRQIRVAITSFNDNSPETTVVTAGLWILNYLERPDVFQIAYTGLDTSATRRKAIPPKRRHSF